MAFPHIYGYRGEDLGETDGGYDPEIRGLYDFDAGHVIHRSEFRIDHVGRIKEYDGEKKRGIDGGDDSHGLPSLPHKIFSLRKVEGDGQIGGYQRRFAKYLKLGPEYLGIQPSGGYGHGLPKSPQRHEYGHQEKEVIDQPSGP